MCREGSVDRAKKTVTYFYTLYMVMQSHGKPPEISQSINQSIKFYIGLSGIRHCKDN